MHAEIDAADADKECDEDGDCKEVELHASALLDVSQQYPQREGL